MLIAVLTMIQVGSGVHRYNGRSNKGIVTIALCT